MVLILSAYEDIGLKAVERSFRLIEDYSEMKFSSLLVPNSGESGMVKDLKGIVSRASEFGRKSTI